MKYAINTLKNSKVRWVDQKATQFKNFPGIQECIQYLCKETKGSVQSLSEREDGSYFVEIGETKDCVVQYHIQTENEKRKKIQVFDEMDRCFRKARDSKEYMEKMKQMIREHGKSYFETYGEGLFFTAAAFRYTEIVELFLELGTDVNGIDRNGSNVLVYVLENSLEVYELVAFFVEKGVDVNTVEKGRNSPLLKAIEYDLYEVGELLYKHGADLNVSYHGTIMFGEKCDDYGVIEQLKYVDRGERKKWVDLLLQNPERCEEKLLKKLKAKRMEFLIQ